MSTAIVKQDLQPTTWAMIQTIATSAKASGKLGLFKQEEAEIKMLTAWENGLPLTSAFQTVHVINNVPALSPKAIWGKIVISPEFAGYEEEQLLDSKGAFLGYKITLKRKNGIVATRQFTLEDAKRANLNTKDNWVMYGQAMCYWRAQGFVQDVVFPDITLGMVRADALGAMVTTEGDVVEGSWSVIEQKKPTQPSDPNPAVVLNDLIAQYGAEKILAVNDGKIPSTLQEMVTVAANLRNAQTVDLDSITIEGVAEKNGG
jgi:hypothetical protein